VLNQILTLNQILFKLFLLNHKYQYILHVFCCFVNIHFGLYFSVLLIFSNIEPSPDLLCQFGNLNSSKLYRLSCYTFISQKYLVFVGQFIFIIFSITAFGVWSNHFCFHFLFCCKCQKFETTNKLAILAHHLLL
jgi:hypothetical protein